jgi:hypothetical protein
MALRSMQKEHIFPTKPATPNTHEKHPHPDPNPAHPFT